MLTVILRGVVTLPAHIFFGIFMGYYLGLSKKCDILKDKKNGLNVYL